MSCKILSSVLDHSPCSKNLYPPSQVLFPKAPLCMRSAQWAKDAAVSALSDTKLHRNLSAQGEIPGIIPGHFDLSLH